MSSLPQNVLELPLERRALLALKAAVKKAIAERTREGLPVYVWSGGKVVELSTQKSRACGPRRSKRSNQSSKTR